MPKYQVTEQAKSDKGVIFLGILVFVGLMFAATIYNWVSGKARATPVLEKPRGVTKCVRETQWMRENHMNLLLDWRDQVVRDGDRTPVKVEGKTYARSLTQGCMKCHQDKATFCDRCHQWSGLTRAGGADLDCWQCHIQPPKPKAQAAQAGR